FAPWEVSVAVICPVSLRSVASTSPRTKSFVAQAAPSNATPPQRIEDTSRRVMSWSPLAKDFHRNQRGSPRSDFHGGFTPIVAEKILPEPRWGGRHGARPCRRRAGVGYTPGLRCFAEGELQARLGGDTNSALTVSRRRRGIAGVRKQRRETQST